MSLKPVKRLEMILDGQDIEPVTRLEYFLKKAAEGGGGGSGVMYFDITVEGTFPDTHLVSSKTFTEIMSAISAGIVPIAKYRFVNNNNTVLLTLVNYSDTLLMFSSISVEKDPDENYAVNLLGLKILSTNDVEEDTVGLSPI